VRFSFVFHLALLVVFAGAVFSDARAANHAQSAIVAANLAKAVAQNDEASLKGILAPDLEITYEPWGRSTEINAFYRYIKDCSLSALFPMSNSVRVEWRCSEKDFREAVLDVETGRVTAILWGGTPSYLPSPALTEPNNG